MQAFCKHADINLILEMVRGWVKLLANRDFGGAAGYLTPVPNSKVKYSATTISEALGRYSRQYREAPAHEKERLMPSVTPIELMDASGEIMTIYKRINEVVIEYDLPIHGKWSDLTAKFLLIDVPGGFGLGLLDLHVL